MGCGLFPWGANICYFHGSPGCHETFHPRNFPPMKFSTHCVALSTRAQIWTGGVLFFATCTPLTVSLIHRVSFLKLSRVWGLRKWTEECGSTTNKDRVSTCTSVEEPLHSHHSKRIGTARCHSCISIVLASQMSLSSKFTLHHPQSPPGEKRSGEQSKFLGLITQKQ